MAAPSTGPARGRPGRRPGPSRDRVRDPLAGGRETIESIVVAFTLALLFRAFEAEAFVIPTGSMAPTLMGRHKDLACESCGSEFRVGCSSELDETTNTVRADRMVAEAECPNCRFRTELKDRDRPGRYRDDYPSFSGDRILVNKFAYDLASPARWDVVVFKYPEDAKTNYIKRLVGLPGETLVLWNGDVWTRRPGADAPAIERKPAAALVAMLQCVHDSRHVAPELVRAGWPAAWTDWSAPDGAPACRWTTTDDGRSHAVACPAGESALLRYRHILPTAEDWRRIRAGQRPEPARPTRVDDFQPYNSGLARLHPVGDLAVEVRLTSRGGTGQVEFDLVEDGAVHRCTIDLADGSAVLAPDAATGGAPVRVATAVRGRGSWTVLFANVDDELSLFIDGRRVDGERPATWQATLGAPRTPALADAEPGAEGPSDLAPAGIRATGADLVLEDLRLLRDCYYIGAVAVTGDGNVVEEEALEFPLGPDQFLVLGDNSAASKDSRLWSAGHHVDRRMLIGRALVVFWPHAVPARWALPLRFGGWDLRLPSWPNFARMRFVR